MMPTTRYRSECRDRYTEELCDGECLEKRILQSKILVRETCLASPHQGFIIIVLIQECYEHGSKWAIVLWGNDAGVGLEVHTVLYQINHKCIFMNNLAGMSCPR